MGFIVLYIPSNVSKSVAGFYYSGILDFWKSARRRFPAKVNSSVINAGEFRLFICCSSKEGEQQRINTALLQKCSYSSAGLSMTSDLKSFICHLKTCLFRMAFNTLWSMAFRAPIIMLFFSFFLICLILNFLSTFFYYKAVWYPEGVVISLLLLL